MNDKNEWVIVAHGVKKAYREGEQTVEVLKGVDLSVRAGELLAIVGASGSGKSTLLHVLGGLDSIDEGEVVVAGMAVHTLNEVQRGQLRNKKLGFVYQFHHLLPEFIALENVAMPLIIRRVDEKQAKQKAKEALEALGLAHRLNHLPSQMSGGERQRCAIARAMVTKPACILADEPTGNLDRQTASSVFDSLVSLAKSHGTACVIVTHDMELAARCDRTVTITDGVIVEH
ncbi:MAG TPA: ABC transporter ATP-binding protein [Candidatus Aphodousia faecigallinarum]|uniref:ABC transporter ATP-binding protein n=1 Tax=Candidatus Aphodousia faecigallinarum TaxID=2840677 RepID=A0A9D1IK32_9BURK|nr:ABC transporter ATP-binding protein [Candidatus Aphodousia faecigallinarum]